MKNFTLLTFFFLVSLKAYSTVWTITNSGFSFSPSTLTIVEGDTVLFDLDSDHNSAEVSMSTWNANGNTPLPGGWLTGFGGGMVLPSDLTVGTHFYVCQPHANMGMKGQIIVQQSTAVKESPAFGTVSIYPNPTSGRIHLLLDADKMSNNTSLDVFDMQGLNVYSVSNLRSRTSDELDLSHLSPGFYFIRLYDEHGILTRRIVVE